MLKVKETYQKLGKDNEGIEYTAVITQSPYSAMYLLQINKADGEWVCSTVDLTVAKVLEFAHEFATKHLK